VNEALGSLDDLSPSEQSHLAAVAANMRKRREAAMDRTRNCSRCGKFMEGTPAPGRVCKICKVRTATCILCGDKTSEFVCPDCIAAGARICEFCLRPAPSSGGMCEQCNRESRRMNAGQFNKVGEAAPEVHPDNPLVGTLTIPPPGSQWSGGPVNMP
jgi:hypothetical protein